MGGGIKVSFDILRKFMLAGFELDVVETTSSLFSYLSVFARIMSNGEGLAVVLICLFTTRWILVRCGKDNIFWSSKELVASIEFSACPHSTPEFFICYKPRLIISRFLDMEKLGFMTWLIKFVGFRERLLADDLFLAKVGIECGVGLFTETAAEYSWRKENFFNELEVVFAIIIKHFISRQSGFEWLTYLRQPKEAISVVVGFVPAVCRFLGFSLSRTRVNLFIWVTMFPP